jgi:hypothetical protein
MSGSARLFLCLSLLTLTACTELLPVRLISQKQIEQWVSQQQFGKAIDVLQRRNKQYPSKANRQQLARVTRLAKQYASKVSSNVIRLQADGKWRNALYQLGVAQKNYPQSKTLASTRKLIRQRQAIASYKLQTRLLLARGQWLLDSSAPKKSLAKINPYNSRLQKQAREVEKNRAHVARELTQRGITALNNRKYSLAEKCLTVADRLHFSGETTMALAKLAAIRYRIQQRLKQARKKREVRRHRRRVAIQIRRAKHALNNDQLLKARKIITALKNSGSYHSSLYRLDNSIEAAIRNRISDLIHSGDELYSHGNIKGALETWRSALRLQANNRTLISRINRAERVLKHLEELRRRQQSQAR